MDEAFKAQYLRQDDERRGHTACRPPSLAQHVMAHWKAHGSSGRGISNGRGGHSRADLHLPIISDMGGSPTSMPCNQAARKLVSIMGSLVISSRKRSAVGSRTGGSSEWIISLTHLTSTTLYLCPLPCLTLDTIKIELTAPMDRAFRYL
jgi:hypothetical protein